MRAYRLAERSVERAERPTTERSSQITRRDLLLGLGGSVTTITLLSGTRGAQAKAFDMIGTAQLTGAAKATIGVGKGKNDKSFMIYVDSVTGADAVRTVSFTRIDQNFVSALLNGANTSGTLEVGGRSLALTAVGRTAGGITTVNLTVGGQQGAYTTQMAPAVAGIGAVAGMTIVGLLVIGAVAISAIDAVRDMAIAKIESQNEGGSCTCESENAEGFMSEPICDELGLRC